MEQGMSLGQSPTTENLPAATAGFPAAPLKVLHLLAALPVGGAEDLVAAIVRGLNPERFAAVTAVMGAPGPVGRQLMAEGYPVISLGLDLKRASFWHLTAAVRRLLQAERPDLLHTHLYHPNLYGRLGALGLGLPVVASVHNSYTQTKFHRRVWNFFLGQVCDRILVGSSQVWRDVWKFDRVSPSRLLLLPYGIPLKELATPLTREEARARLGVSGLVIGAVGRLEEQKGHEYLLAALPALSREIGDLTVLLVGDGRRAEKLAEQARCLGVEGQVRFLGTRRDLPEIFRALDIFVQPSLWEGLPLALLKAMGAGLPVMATRVSGALEVVQDGGNGCLVEPGDPQALARAILDLWRQPQKRQRFGAAARHTVAATYSLEAMLTKLEDLYLDLWRRGRRA